MERLRPRDDAGSCPGSSCSSWSACCAALLVAGVALPVARRARAGRPRQRRTGSSRLPAELEIPPLPERSRILAADGSLIATFYYENRISVPLTEVAPVMRQAIVAIEDSRFYEHGGIDLRGTVRALVNNQSGKDVQGGSTLTQQYVKQVLLETAAEHPDPKKRAAAQKAATAQSYTRKLRELRYAVALEEQVHQAADPRALPQHRLLRRRRVRRRGGRPALLQHPCPRPDPAAGRAARRHRAAADGVRPDPQPGRAPWPGATSCSPGWRRSG